MPPDGLSRASAWRASLVLAFERRGERSVLASRRHDGPLVVQKALHPEGPGVCHAIVVHPPAGIAGGDELAIEAAAGEGAHALLTTPGAAKWYRSAGPRASQRVTLACAPGSALEWLPQESIVYDGAQADIAWEARLDGDARLIAWDIVCLGRTGSGERFGRGHLRLEARVRRDGRTAWLERGELAPESARTLSAAGLGGHPVFGTFVACAPAIDDAWLAEARMPVPASGEAGVTRLPGILIARWRGDSSAHARAYFTALWRRLRPPLLGRDALEPRIWST